MVATSACHRFMHATHCGYCRRVSTKRRPDEVRKHDKIIWHYNRSANYFICFISKDLGLSPGVADCHNFYQRLHAHSRVSNHPRYQSLRVVTPRRIAEKSWHVIHISRPAPNILLDEGHKNSPVDCFP